MKTLSTDAVLRMWEASQRLQALSERTIEERSARVRALLRYTGEPALRISAVGIESYLSRPGLKASTLATYQGHIRAYCKWVTRKKLRKSKSDPSNDLERAKRPRSFPRPVADGELARMLAVANRRRTRTMILFAAVAGLRVHEVAQLRGEDMDLERGILTVTGKGGKTAMIPMEEVLIDEARHYPRTGWLFPAYSAQTNAEHISRQGVGDAIRSALRRAGVNATPHQLRHWYGTTLLSEGANLRVVQELMRHTSPATTQIYTKVTLIQERAAIGTLRRHLPEAA